MSPDGPQPSHSGAQKTMRRLVLAAILATVATPVLADAAWTATPATATAENGFVAASVVWNCSGAACTCATAGRPDARPRPRGAAQGNVSATSTRRFWAWARRPAATKLPERRSPGRRLRTAAGCRSAALVTWTAARLPAGGSGACAGGASSHPSGERIRAADGCE